MTLKQQIGAQRLFALTVVVMRAVAAGSTPAAAQAVIA